MIATILFIIFLMGSVSIVLVNLYSLGIKR